MKIAMTMKMQLTMHALKKATKLPTAIAFALARVSSITFLRLLPRGYFMLCGERRQSAFSDLPLSMEKGSANQIVIPPLTRGGNPESSRRRPRSHSDMSQLSLTIR